MKQSFLFILSLIVELLLLLLIFLFLFLGVLGIFLPIIPGLILVAFAVSIYSLMIKNNFGTLTPKIHRQLLISKNKILQLSITKKFMGIIKKIQQKKVEKAKEEILKHGMILAAFNFALVLGLVFAFIALSILMGLLKLQLIFFLFGPALLIFLFAGVSAVVWYRFGQILGQTFEERKILNSALVVLVSILPLLGVMFSFSSMVDAVGGFGYDILALTFLSIIFMSILAAVFELLIVSLGVVTQVEVTKAK